MTTATNINTQTILSFVFGAKSTKLIRDQYNINMHVITVLFACYVCSEYISKEISLKSLNSVIGYYNHKRIKVYLSSLVDNNMLTFSGRKYTLTNQGYKTIEDISNNYDNVIYQFCSKFNIEL